MYWLILLMGIDNNLLGDPEPTLAAVCQCKPGEACQCGDSCDCHPIESKMLASVAKFDRVNNSPTAPYSRAPDPDYPETYSALADFQARHADGVSKVYKGAKLPPEQSGAARRLDMAQAQPDRIPAAVGIAVRQPIKAQPPVKTQPIDRAVMVWSCQNGTCQWVPASSVPTKSVQSYQRRGLFGLRRR